MQNDALQQILMTASRERSERSVLRIIVDGLAEQPHVALARIWLTGPGDICATCRMRPECPDQSRCLHLEASSGRSLAEPGADWTQIDGDFRRFPVGVRKVGQIAATGIPLFVANTAEQSEWIARPEWATREHIRSFAGQPLVFGSETLGVIAVFSRVELSEIDIRWLRLFANQAAITLVNARAFEEIERLKRRLELENEYLREEISQSQAFGDLIGSSPGLQKVLEQIDLVAGTNANVLILGESGTGKELVARAIHQRSQRRDRPLVKVNCASIPKELFESEFFGHAKGAFTGALRDRIGRFQLADGGTIFLDEVGEIPLDLQSKLLRVLQEREFERVGEEISRRVDVRIIAATNRDLEADARAGRFREDLYYRLGVFPIQAPPLRDRTADIGPLAAHFVRHVCEQLNLPTRKLTRGDVERLERYDWPGNIRELQNVIERALIAHRVSLGQPPCSSESGAYCQARKRLPEQFFSAVARLVGRNLDARVDQRWLWRGRRVCLFDGTTVSMPDTPQNRAEYPLAYNQVPGTNFALARVGAIISLSCGAILDLGVCRYAGKGQGEVSLLRRLWDVLRPGDVLLGDRLMSGWVGMLLLKQRGVDTVSRLSAHRRADFRRGRRLGKDDHIVNWKKPTSIRSVDRRTYNSLPDSIAIREARFRVEQPGFRTRSVVVVTTLLDPGQASKEGLASLYRARWNNELDLRSIKVTLQMDTLRCKTPDLVRKEIWTHALAYNLIRTVMAQAAAGEGVPPREISFKATLQVLEAFRPLIDYRADRDASRLAALYGQLLRAIAVHRVGDRPDRFEPRMAKRRPKRYDRLTRPRAEIKRRILKRVTEI